MIVREIIDLYRHLLTEGMPADAASSLTLAHVIHEAMSTPEGGFEVKRGAKYLGISPSQLRKEYQAGRINYYRSGRKVLFTQHDLDTYRQHHCSNRLSCSSERENQVLRLAQT